VKSETCSPKLALVDNEKGLKVATVLAEGVETELRLAPLPQACRASGAPYPWTWRQVVSGKLFALRSGRAWLVDIGQLQRMLRRRGAPDSGRSSDGA
jgi:hypothetical protein